MDMIGELLIVLVIDPFAAGPDKNTWLHRLAVWEQSKVYGSDSRCDLRRVGNRNGRRTVEAKTDSAIQMEHAFKAEATRSFRVAATNGAGRAGKFVTEIKHGDFD